MIFVNLQLNMDYVRKITLLILIIVLTTPYLARLSAQTEVDDTYADSLCTVLKQTESTSDKIVILKELANIYWQQPEEVTYIKELIKLSENTDSIQYVYLGLNILCRYYYNESKEDSLLYWKNQVDSLARERSERPEAFYSVGNLLCKYYLGTQNYELAINEAISLINEAHIQQQDNGLMKANQSLGYVYQIIGRDSDAVEAYKEGYAYLQKINATANTEMQYISEMLISYLHENLLDESEQLVKRYHSLYNSEEEKYKARGMDFPVPWHHWLIYSYYAELYIKRGNYPKAAAYLDKARISAEKSSDEVMKCEYFRVSALYYYTVHNYKAALNAINRVLDVEILPNILKLKINILRADGQKKKAIELFDQLFILNSKISDDAFERQIQQLRSLNDLNDQEKIAYELEHQSQQLSMRQHLLVMAMVVSLILIVLLSVVFRYYIHTRKLKNALLTEKNSLVESEKQLRIAKDKAEEANQLKTAFISNISHEVRTPLNAIVGFSQLLADNSFQEAEKRAFSGTIQKNSELLMNLVNDVLDLSRLESGKILLNRKACDIVKCCQEILDSISHNIAPGVKATVTSPVEQYILNTDDYRIKQLLGGLLRNAAKFTSQGEINLAIEIEDAKHQVRFIVTDTGCGIPAEMQYKIFDSFEKLDEFAQGTGLGLPICKKVAELLDGNLFLDSSYTFGAKFVFIHPISFSNTKSI